MAVAKVDCHLDEQMITVEVKARNEEKYTKVKWLPDSGVKRSLLSEADWDKVKKENPTMKLKKNNVTFSPYGTEAKLPGKGRVKVVLRNEKVKAVKMMVYIVTGQEESLLGKNYDITLGIIKMSREGDPPTEGV